MPKKPPATEAPKAPIKKARAATLLTTTPPPVARKPAAARKTARKKPSAHVGAGKIAKPNPLPLPKGELEVALSEAELEAPDREEIERRGGRPSLYQPEYVEIARRVCSILGATDAELAMFLGFSERTINAWKKQHPEFGAVLNLGKLDADSEVAARLYKKALGYEHDDIDVRAITLPGVNAGSEVVITPVTRVVQPDTQAITWWLKNRRPQDWKDKTETTVEVVNMDLETAETRFASKMREAMNKAAETRARRQTLGMTGD